MRYWIITAFLPSIHCEVVAEAEHLGEAVSHPANYSAHARDNPNCIICRARREERMGQNDKVNEVEKELKRWGSDGRSIGEVR